MRRARLRVTLASALVAAAALTAGCATPKLDRGYGKSSGASINGTRVFFDVLRARGHEVRRVSSFHNRFLDDAQVVVWFERDPDGVPWTSVEDAATWLEGHPGRTLVYVANDFDSDLVLWDDLAGHFHTAGQAELETRSRALQANTSARLAEQAKGLASGSWTLYPFAFAGSLEAAKLAADLDPATPLARDLGGAGRVYVKRHPSAVEPPPPPAEPADAIEPPGGEAGAEEMREPRAAIPPERGAPDAAADAAHDSAGEDEVEVEIHEIGPTGQRVPPEAPGEKTLRELRGKASPAADAVWLASEARPLVLARQVSLAAGERSTVVLVHNGSFLLNYALVDPVHRTLAARLADQLGERRKIAFYEPANASGRIWSPWGRLPPGGPSPIDVLFRPPLGWVFLHFLIAALLYLASQAPIFGRPRTDDGEPGAPFTQHVRAYGKLLERTGDRAYVDHLLAEHARRGR